jgi:iron complex outermembrane receptor protein
MFGACTSSMDPVTSYVEPNNMKRVQVSPGPDFDANGATVGGGMNFTLRQAQINAPRKWTGSAGTGFETNASARQWLGNLQYSGKRFAFSVDGIYRKAGNYTPGGNKDENIQKYGQGMQDNGFSVDAKGRINRSQYQKWNAHANASYQLGAHQTLSADYLHDEGKDIGYPALPMDVNFDRANMGSLTHEYRNADRALYFWQTKIYYNEVNHDMDNLSRPDNGMMMMMRMDMPGRTKTAGAFTQLCLKPSALQLICLKAESYVNRWHAGMTMDPGGSNAMSMLTIPDAQRTVAGLDISDEIRIGNFWQLTPGARLEYNRSSIYSPDGKMMLAPVYAGNPDKTRWLYNAYLQLSYHPLSPFGFGIKLARGMRAPTLREAYALYLYNNIDGYDYLGNPALKKEKSFSSELSISYKGKEFEATLKGFGYFFQDYIAGFVQPGLVPQTMDASGVKQYGNISSAYITGASLLLDWSITQRISFSSSTVWQEGRDKNKNSLPLMPPLKSVNTVRYNVNSWRFFAEGVSAATQNKVSGFYGETRTPGFFIMNAGADKTITFHGQQIIFGLTCSNIFNKYYYEHLDVIKLPREGRDFILHLTYNF